jgi:hypothetical protein
MILRRALFSNVSFLKEKFEQWLVLTGSGLCSGICVKNKNGWGYRNRREHVRL